MCQAHTGHGTLREECAFDLNLPRPPLKPQEDMPGGRPRSCDSIANSGQMLCLTGVGKPEMANPASKQAELERTADQRMDALRCLGS